MSKRSETLKEAFERFSLDYSNIAYASVFRHLRHDDDDIEEINLLPKYSKEDLKKFLISVSAMENRIGEKIKDCNFISGEVVFKDNTYLDRFSDIDIQLHHTEEDYSEWWSHQRPSTPKELFGVTDKNGKEVYEGDIVRWIDPDGNEHVDLIEWNSGGLDLCNAQYTVGLHGLIEVIGNIHDNPELTKN